MHPQGELNSLHLLVHSKLIYIPFRLSEAKHTQLKTMYDPYFLLESRRALNVTI